MRKYQRALDVLEGLIVSRMFELTKMNRSQTGKLFYEVFFFTSKKLTFFISGYAMRKHIGKALQARSSAIRTALDRYNTAAQALSPPRRMLHWKEVVEYAFLADFDLLRDARQDISQRPWATPAARLAMDLHFKICRAKEEIQRLNIEIPRVATYIRDEDLYLRACEDQVRAFNPQLAHHIYLHRMERGRFIAHHTSCLTKISQLKGFSGSITPGQSVDTSAGASASVPNIKPSATPIDEPLDARHEVGGQIPPEEDTEEDLEEEEEVDDSVEVIASALVDILHVSDDPAV